MSLHTIEFIVNISVFLLGILGILLNKKNILVILISIELILLSVSLTYLITSTYIDEITGQMMSLMVLTVAAGEAAIGLSVLIVYYRIRGHTFIDSFRLILKG